MNDSNRRLDHSAGQPDEPARRPWSTPKLTRLRARYAEAGPNPLNTEGQFGTGS